MADTRSRTSPPRQRWLVLLLSMAMLSGLLAVVPPSVRAEAAEAVVFNNPFKNNTVNGTGTVTKPTSPSGTNQACLTATGNTATTPLLSCSGTTDAQGSGVLRLTAAAGNQIGSVFGSTGFATTSGLEFSFNSYQYGGNSADGMSFVLAAANPTTPVPPTTIGPGGAQLGYSPDGGTSGVTNGYLGVGLDVYGGFSGTSSSGSGCTNPTNIAGNAPGAIVVRGPGSGTVGYCGLTTTYAGTTASQLTLRASTRAASVVPVKVLVNPTTATLTSSDGSSVAAGSYKVIATPVGGTAKTLTGTLPVAPSTLYPATTWVNANGVPKQLAFGFVGSTGGSNDVHEVSDVQVRTFDPDPAVSVSTTAYAASTSAAGDPVTYVARTSVSGAPVTSQITVTHTTPTGVLPLAAYANGFTCGSPSGQTISCTSTGSSYSVGSSSPDITIVAIATTSITAATIRSSSSTTATATGATSGSATAMGTGTLPTAPTGVAVSPGTGSTAGGGTVTVTGSNITAATAVEIGTTNQLQNGTPVTLLACASGVTASCFAVSGSNLLVYMPARSNNATVSITVVTRGVAGADSYVYAAKPSIPTRPTATAGTTSAVVNWSAPAANGSPITSYTVTPYLGTTAQTPIPVASTATSLTVSGLTAGASYTFTVSATNAIGTSNESNKSTAVVPYDVPGAPTIGSAVAADLAATLSWTAPSSNGGSAVTGYVVTPYIGTAAQAPQTFASTATSQSITGLTAGTAYTFTVAARNAAGTGPASASSAPVTPNAAPTLTFAAPPPGFVGVAYSAQLAATDGTSPFTWSVSSGTLPPGLTLATSSGLLSGTPTVAGSYTATIRVVDASNQSATKAVTLVVTGPPEAPARPTATAGLTEVTLAWTAPSSNGDPITSYVITPYLAGSAQTPVTVDAAATTRVLRGLTAGGSYTFTVAAVNGRGTSVTSAASAAVVPYAALSAPTITSVRAGNSSVALTWTAPTSDGGSPITGYLVTPYIGSVAQPPQAFPGTATSRTLTGLTPGTAYTFQVAAQNASGATSVYRVNSGGPLVTATDGGPDWSADNAATNPYHDTGSSFSSFSPAVTLDGTVPAGTPVTLFDDERFDPGSKNDGGEMLWQFPVTSGASVRVRLYLAERYYNSGPGTRVFDVNIDGTAALSNFDLIGGAGGSQIGTVREFPVTSDGSVDIDFGHEVENPLVSAIEIVRTGLDTTGPASASSAAATPNASPTLTFPAPPSGEVGVAYSTQLVVTGGTSPFTWSVSAGALPAGITLNPTTGLLSGTPTAAGSASFTVQVVDAGGESATKAVTLVVAAAPTLAFSPAAGEVAVAYSQQPVVTGGTAPYTWKVSAGSLPAGVALNASTGLVSGTPTTAGTSNPTLTVTDAFGVSASRAVTITIAALPTLTFSAPPSGQVAVAYSTSFTAAGGTAPLVWSISAGSVPSGLSLNTSTGVLSGTPTTVASSSFTVTVKDANNKTASRAVTLVVAAGPLVIAKTANVSSTVPGGVVAFTTTLTNTGTGAFTGVTLTDPLSTPGSVADDATYNADGTATSGSLSYAGGALSWTGDVAAGGSVTITYSVTVNNPDTGNLVLSSTVTSSTSGTNCPSSSTDARCTATVTVSGLSIVKRADSSSTTPGSVVRFTVVATNTGRTAYTGATWTDSLTGVLDDATYNGNATATTGSVSYASSAITWTGNLAVGASSTTTYTVTVADPDTGNRSLTGTVVSPTAGSTCPGGNTSASCTATVTVLVPALAISNTAGVTTTTPGSSVPYTITVSNTGQTAYTGTSVTVALAAALDDATYNGDAITTAGSVVYSAAARTLVWTGDLAVGTAVTITASVTVTDPDPGDRTLTTVASSAAAGSTCPSGTTNAACTTTVQVRVPALTITKATGASTTTPGSVVTHTVTATNTGQTAYSGASFSDDLTGLLDDASYNGDGSASVGSLSYTAPTLIWTGSLAVGATVTVTYTVTVKQPDPGNLTLTDTVVSTAAGSTCPPGTTRASCSSSVAVLVPGLSVTSAASVSTTTPGSVVTYTISVANTGQTTYTGATVLFDPRGALDDADSNNDARVSTGNQTAQANGTLLWTLTLAPGATATATLSVTVMSPDPGDRSLRTTVTSDAAGSTCPTGSTAAGCRTTVPVLIPGLTITKTSNASSVVTGGVVTYTVSVLNTGETDYPAASFTDSLATVLSDASYDADATATSGTVSYAGQTVSWSGALAVGARATVRYSVTVLDPDPGDKRLTNTVVSTSVGSNCAASSTDPRCTSVVDVLVPELTIAKTADRPTSVPEGRITFTVTVTNSGAVPYPGATFTDALSGTLDDAVRTGDATATSGSVSATASALTWTGDLAVGATATITYSVTVNAADVGDDLVTGTVTSTTRGSTCAAGSTDPRCSVTVPVARLVLTQTYDEDTTTPGSVVHARGTFANTGQGPYTNLKIYLHGDANDDGVSNGDQTVSSGTLVIDPPDVYWTGDIPVGGTVTGSGTITINDPDTGDHVISASLSSDAPGNNCPDGSTDSRCGDSLRVLEPHLTITKTADTATVVPGGSVRYTVTVTNTGQTDYTAATGTAAVVTDTLTRVVNHATYDQNATATTGSLSYRDSTLSWTGDLSVGASATVITYSVTTLSPATGDKVLMNSVSSANTGSTCPPDTGGAGCRTTTMILTPALTVTKTADVSNATLGATVTYTLSATNTGQTSYPGASLTDSLAGVLDDATYNPAATTGDPVYSAGTLSWTGPLAVGETKTITYTVTVNDPGTGNLALDNTVTSTTEGSNCAAGSGDPRCRATVVITNAVALTLTKTADVVSTVDGGRVVFTVTATNASAAALSSVNFTDPLGGTGVLDDATYDDDAVVSAGAVTYADSTLTWTGTVPAGGTVRLRYSVTVGTPATGDLLLTSKISSTSPSVSNNCLPGSSDPRCVVTVPVARLTLVGQALETSASPGALVHIPTTYTNTGRVPYTGISVSIPRGDSADDLEVVGEDTVSSGTLVRTSDAIVWRGDIAVGQTVTFNAVRRVKNPPTGNRVATATLVSDAPGNNCPTGTTDQRCTFRVAVVVPQLTITTTASPGYVVPGGTVRYSVAVRNTGETAYTGAVVEDTLAGLLDDARYNGDAVASAGTVAYSSPVLTWTGDLAIGATATVSFTVTALSPPPGDKIAVNAVTSSTVGSTCPPASGSSACRTNVLVLTPALTITSRASQATAVPGDVVTFTVTASNTGQTAHTPAALTVPLGGVLDDATYQGDATATGGTVAVDGQTLSWSGNLAPGAAATITYSVLVRASTSGDSRLAQTVSSANQGSTCPAGSACTTSVAVAGLRILNSADVTTTEPTQVVHYTATFTNTGQVAYTGISITNHFAGALDDATYGGDAVTTSGSVTADPTSGAIVWTGDLPVGGTVTVTGSGTVDNPDLGDKILSTRITTRAPASNCPVGGTDPACATTVPVLTPGLTVTNVPSATTVEPGRSLDYTLTIANTGQTRYPEATVTNSLTGLADDAVYRGDAVASAGTVTFTDPVLRWTGDLAVGQTVVITYSVLVDAPDLGDKALIDQLASDAVGSSCPPGGSTAGCSTRVRVLVPAVALAVTADSTTTIPGATVTYTMTVSNTGETDAPGASVVARLDGALDDADYDSNATADVGSVSYAAPGLTWTGDLAVGATATVTYTMTVRDPDTGDRLLAVALDSRIPGSACSTGTGGPGTDGDGDGDGEQDDSCSSTVTVLIPGLAVETSADVASATPGDVVTYTVTVRNTGETAYVGTQVRTGLTDVLDDATFDGDISSSSGVATYSAPTLTWTGSLPVGASATITYSVTILSPPAGDRRLSSTVVAPAQGSTCPEGTANSSCTAVVTVLVPALTIMKSAGAPTTTPGGQVAYTITITNSGETAYTGAVVTDSLSGLLNAATYGADATVTGGGVLGYADSTLTWTGDLLPGASATVHYSVRVKDPYTGDRSLSNSVVSSAAGSSCPSGEPQPGCTAVVRVLIPALGVTQTADRTSVVAGDRVRYTVTLTNTGETDHLPATFRDAFADPGILRFADYAGDATATVGTVEYAGTTLVWTGPLLVGETATVTFSVVTRYPAPAPVNGTRVMRNSVTSATAGSTCVSAAAARCRTTVTVLSPALTLAKTADADRVVAGGTVGYTITASNTGQADYAAASFQDPLAELLDEAVYNADATASTGSVSYQDGTLRWAGPLARGATVVLTFSVTVDPDVTGDSSLSNRVVSTSVGSTCPPGSTDPACVVTTEVEASTISLVGLTSDVTLTGAPGSVVTQEQAVSMTVVTNSVSGYSVTARATSDSLVGQAPGNTDTIPVDRLSVRPSGTTLFTPLSAERAVTVHQQSTPSSVQGDAVTNDYQVDVPFVASDTYSTTVEYIATVQ